MATMLRLKPLGMLCAAIAALAAGAGAASAVPMGADTLQRRNPSSDVLRVFDPDQRAYDRTLSHWRRSHAYRYHHGRHMRYMRARGRR
jgi:hypothetical protein